MRPWILVAMTMLLAPAGLPTGTFDLRPPAGRVEFLVRDNRGGFTGETREVTGTVVVRERGEGYLAEVEARIDARTIRTGATLRDAQMRGAAFLNTAQFPFITFKGTVTAADGPGPQFAGVMRGALTIRNVTREVEMPLEIAVEGSTYTARGEATVRMSDFGIPIPRFLIFVAEDPVTVRLQVRLQRLGSSS